jgi:hypothetical protein
MIPVHTENRKKSLNVFYGKNAKFLLIKAGGTYGYHWAIKSQSKFRFRQVLPYVTYSFTSCLLCLEDLFML